MSAGAHVQLRGQCLPEPGREGRGAVVLGVGVGVVCSSPEPASVRALGH